MRTMVTLENLSDDVLYQIVGHLRSERSFTLRCLRIVSSRLKIFAESILYRKLVLQDDDDHELASSGFIERLQNPLDTLSQHVRNLHVKSFRGDDESCCMNTNLLLTCLKRLRRLDSFSWDCDFPIPNEIMDTLHLRWPQAQLRATMKDLDYKTLQSPQLHCLRVCLPKLVSDPVITINLWNSVKRVLLYCPKLRALSIDVRPVATDRFTLVVTPEVPPGLNTTNTTVSSYYDDSRPPDHTEALSALDQKIQLPLTRDDGLFELHDLNIRARSYTLDLEHCQLLLGCLDTNKLQRLRLGPSNPKHFFNTFAGQLTHLQHDITFMLQPESWYPAIAYPVFELVNCAEFTTSLISLRSLIIRCNVVSWHDPLWARLADAHGTRLRHLSIQAHQPDRQAPEIIGALPHMLRQFTALTTLHLALQESDTYNHLCAFCDHGTDASATSTRFLPFRTSQLSASASNSAPVSTGPCEHICSTRRRTYTTPSANYGQSSRADQRPMRSKLVA
ncbi:hypothetical protein T440DRAFT_188977 [Plenodomus tracheiphilus IPT5]|uniref:F-box domain-containing protein n=1 Tax=Plenodomus tracheiphilus IPT5 TaxID=1408161 RepID=A0A6A7AWW0_9PLEO|nr:hypothetical protein T440DRAFT_188977 [Plenodomus tracheiphilus IPT5]